eukprot:1185003-Prorocentrum_minimum.AAC.3
MGGVGGRRGACGPEAERVVGAVGFAKGALVGEKVEVHVLALEEEVLVCRDGLQEGVCDAHLVGVEFEPELSMQMLRRPKLVEVLRHDVFGGKCASACLLRGALGRRSGLAQRPENDRCQP